jgi:hypothetical protein
MTSVIRKALSVHPPIASLSAVPTAAIPALAPTSTDLLCVEITGFRDLPLGVLCNISDYSEDDDLSDEIFKINQILLSCFPINPEKFVRHYFYEHPLTTTSMQVELCNPKIIAAIGQCFRHLSCFWCDAAYLHDHDLAAFHLFKQLKGLRLHHCFNIKPDGLKQLNGITRLEVVALDNAPRIVKRMFVSDRGARSSVRTKIYDEEVTVLTAEIEVNELLCSHETLRAFTSDGVARIKPTDDEFDIMVQKMGDLSLETSYSFEYCHKLTDRSLKLIVERFPALEQMILFGCRNFTPDGLNELQKLRNLCVLSLYGCNKIAIACEFIMPPKMRAEDCILSAEQFP